MTDEREQKHLLSSDDLISYMKRKGIRFDLFSEDNAKKYMETSTYYKKISCYLNYSRRHDFKINISDPLF